MRITAKYFRERTGNWPVDDDLERANCRKAGEVGHFACGWCEKCDLPVSYCGYIHPENRVEGHEA